MAWIYLAIVAYFLDAVVFGIDKFLLAAPIPNPLSYAFYVSLLSVFAVFLLPFGIYLPTLPNLAVAILSGLSFFVALVFLYRSIKQIDILEATPAIGAVSALTTFFVSAFLLSEKITGHELMAFYLLVSGTLVMSYFHLRSRVILNMIVSGVLFGLSYVFLKYFFNTTDFINGLFWTRLGMVGGALSLLAYSGTREQIFKSFDAAPPSSKTIFILNKILAGTAFVILYYAIKIGSVVFVNALQGLQYVFILLIGAFLIKKMPRLFEKHIHEHMPRKIAAIILIVTGFFLLFV